MAGPSCGWGPGFSLSPLAPRLVQSGHTPRWRNEYDGPMARRVIQVLFVEDDAAIAGVATRCLAGRADVVVAPTAAEALQKLRDGLIPDAIVSDVTLVGEPGTVLLERLRAEFPGLVNRFAFLTGSGVTAALQNTGRPCVTKPFKLDQLRRLVDELATEGAEAV